MTCPKCKAEVRAYRKLLNHYRNEHLDGEEGRKERLPVADVAEILAKEGIHPK